MKFRCYVCGERIAGRLMFLFSMSNMNVDRVIVACSKKCVERCMDAQAVRVHIEGKTK